MANPRQLSGGRERYFNFEMNLGEYEGNLELIMERYEGRRERQGFNENHGKVMTYHYFVYF